MKNNILNRFAISDLKKNKRDTINLIVMIFIVSIMTFVLSLFSEKISMRGIEDYQKQYGTYTYYSYHFKGDIHNITLHTNDKDIPLNSSNTCLVHFNGFDLNEVPLCSIEGNPDIIGIKIKDGRLPVNEDEIIVKEEYLKLWGYDSRIGDTIQIPYIYNYAISYMSTPLTAGMFYDGALTKTQDFKIVGIMQQESTMPVIVALNTVHASNLLIETSIKDKISSLEYSDAEHIDLLRNENIDELYNIQSQLTIITMIEVFGYIIASSLIYGISLTSFDKKIKDYTLLRSIGITKKQLYYIIFLQSLILCSIPILASTIVYIVCGFVFGMSFAIEVLLWNIGKILFIVFISYFIPAQRSTEQSLTGAFNNAEHQYFYVRYKKLHKMRPLYLGYRSFVGNNKMMIMKLVLIAVMSFNCMEVVRSYLSVSDLNHLSQINKHYGITLENTSDESYMQLQDIQFLQKYVEDIYIVPYIDSFSDGTQFNYRFKVYCYDNKYKDYWHNNHTLKENEYIINGTELKEYDGDFESQYEVFDNVYTRFIILNSKDYEKFKYFKEHEDISLIFNSPIQKTNMLVTIGQEYIDFINKYELNDDFLNTTVNDFDYTVTECRFLSSVNIRKIAFVFTVMIIYVYLHFFKLLNQKEEVSTYQLIGMTSKEISMIYFIESFLYCFIGCIAGLLFYILNAQYYYGLYSLQNTVLISLAVTIGIVIITIFLSVVPLKAVMKRDAFENKMARD